ncbi:transmembrane protein, putative (macronuclear) [Tetrahymena thermophila SB210]|uniref:Transmembrane protein, putative n=1 Tax=Tetrahymena thermophila (strain SB210) TaxID=312017 RepID=Q23QK3_TETTS|nr:transmembrane protein, putative [Tetrahymena thermophila SB210]EAR98885.2 transmembrane protein, putative [Tetrahymena thermophila SB210]|eukprot:XP_001019130.2 transmembrane protein, putative [Tetrahymena thermophila SB210]
MMKQKHIVATDLISKIESMQNQIAQLKENLNYLIQLNDDNLDLLNLQALFLENLSFSEKDINLLQVNKYKKKSYYQKYYLNRQNEDDMLSSMNNNDKFDEKTCIIFASYRDTETLTINQVSSNFYNLFGFTSRDNIYNRNIESIIPLAFQSVHKMYIKQYLEDSITCNISNDTKEQLEQNEQDHENDENEVTPINQRQGYLFNQPKFLSENQTGTKNKNYQLQNYIKTNEYNENGTFGLVAKIKQINEEYQYILFNETDLSVIGLTQQIHEIFFPNCNNLQKINLRQIFPFLIGTQNKTKIEDSHIQFNETTCSTNNTKQQFHVNLTDDVHYIFRGQLKDKLTIKKKLAFIIIQQADEINNTVNTLNTLYRSTKRLNKAKSYKEISQYSFNYVELFVRKIKYHGVNNVSYVEIVKIKQLNPSSQAQIILQEITNVKKQQIYSQLFEHPSQLQNIISDLEQNQNINSYLQFNSFYTQLQYSSRNLNQGNQLLQIKQNDTPIDFTQADFQKVQQLLGDESTNIEQIKMASNRIEYDDFNCLSDATSRFTLNQFREQKTLQNFNEKLQLNQLSQLQSNIAQGQVFIQSFQENQVSSSDLQMKVDFANNNLDHQNLIEDQLNISSTCAIPIPQKSNKVINIELVSPDNSQFMKNCSNQLSLAQLSDQNLDALQIKSYEFISNKIKENAYLDVENSNEEINKKCNNTIIPLQISINPSKIFKSNSFRKNKITNTLNDALNGKEKKKFIRNSYQHNTVNQIQKQKKKEQVQDIIYDIASSTSHNSYYTPVKRQLTQIMEDSSTLKVIKLIKVIGVICFAVMVGITWLQFNSMDKFLLEANQDYKDFGWPTTYSCSLSDILKYKNIQFLTNYTRVVFTDSNQRELFYNLTQQNMENTFSDVLRLLVQMENANSQREVFNRVMEDKMTFYFGQLYNPAQLNSTTSDSTDLVFLNYTSTLEYGVILNVQNIFRYINNMGNGRPEYYLIQNQLEAINQLKDLQEYIKDSQSQKQEYIQNQLYIIIMILVLINTCCVAIIIPLYLYIQKERDSIIYLFTTFPIQKLDNLIKKIQNSYFSTNTNSIYQNQNNQVIIDTLLQLQDIDNEKNIRKHTKVYQLRSYLLQNIAMHFNVLLMKARPRFKPMKPNIYYDYLYALLQQQDEISQDIQWIINSQYSDQRFNQDLYDNFFFSAFKTNLCEDFKNYPQFNTNPKKLNVEQCDSTQQKFLQQGFSVAYKSLFSMFTELYNIYIIPDDRVSRQQNYN